MSDSSNGRRGVIGALRRLWTRLRRWRLMRAYSRVFSIGTGKSVGFTPTMAAFAAAERDGVLTIDDGELIWHWPEDGDAQ